MKTKIEWTDTTWNVLRGCSRVSEGCKNCYAENIARRFSGPGLPYEGLIAKGGQWNGLTNFVRKKLTEPLSWKNPRRIFVNSMSDLFHESVDWGTLAEIFTIMAMCSQHTFQILTKRPHNMLDFVGGYGNLFTDIQRLAADNYNTKFTELSWPLPNVWLGVSVENQETADERIPLLLQTPAAVRFISAEPLLGPINLKDIKTQNPMEIMLLLSGLTWTVTPTGTRLTDTHPKLDWVVVGGESGPNARPMHPQWVRSLQDQCVAAGTPFLFKQWGQWAPLENHEDRRDWFIIDAYGGFDLPDFRAPDESIGECAMVPIGKKRAGRLLDGRTWDEYPE